jgi:6-phosphogluconolactonase
MRFLLLCLLFSACASPAPLHLFVGTYTQKMGHVDGKASGIYHAIFDPENGHFQVIDSFPGIPNPSFLCIAPDGRHLYAVEETGGSPEQPFGQVTAFSISDQLVLQKINSTGTLGAAPCYISTDYAGKQVLVANYVHGNLATYRIRPDGGLSEAVSVVQHPGEHPWAHFVRPTPGDREIWAVDKGADRLYAYKSDGAGHLTLLDSLVVSSGAGPRHLDFHPQRHGLLALINENQSSIWLVQRQEKGFAVLDSATTLPAAFNGKNSCADVHFHPNGRFVYGSNRGHNSIAVFEVTESGLKPLGQAPCGGKTPRNFVISPDGRWMLVANQDSSTVTVFRIDGQTGALTPAGPPAWVPTPVCLQFFPDTGR